MTIPLPYLNTHCPSSACTTGEREARKADLSRVYANDLVLRLAQAYACFQFPYLQEVVGKAALLPEQLVAHQAAMLRKQPNVRFLEAFAEWYLAWQIGELLVSAAKESLRVELGGWKQYLQDLDAALMDLPEDVVPS